jgi:hypothetical protein
VGESEGKQRVVVLDDWPPPSAGAPQPRVLADDSTLSLLYRTDDDRFAVIQFPLCTFFVFGAPNDEALGGHPLARFGLRHYSVHEVHGSSLVRELERRNSVHPRHDPSSYRRRRHLVFTFKDTTLECVILEEEWWTPVISLYLDVDEAQATWRASTNV